MCGTCCWFCTPIRIFMTCCILVSDKKNALSSLGLPRGSRGVGVPRGCSSTQEESARLLELLGLQLEQGNQTPNISRSWGRPSAARPPLFLRALREPQQDRARESLPRLPEQQVLHHVSERHLTSRHFQLSRTFVFQLPGEKRTQESGSAPVNQDFVLARSR